MSLAPYPKYQQIARQWIARVPSHWEVRPLKYLVDLRSGGTPNKENLRHWDGNVPWASSKDLKVERLADTEDHITQAALDDGAAELVPPDSLLVVVRGMILAHSFPVVRTLVPMAINQDLKALRPKNNLDVGFLAWLLRGSSSATFERIDEAAHGTKVLRLDAWTSIELPVPSIEEQVDISVFLEREVAKIDALVAEQRRLIELLKEKRQAVISHAVTKGLNAAVPVKPSGIEWLGDIPAHWTVVSVRRIVERIEQGWSPDCYSRPANADEWGVVKSGCVNRGIFVENENKALPETLDPIPEYEIQSGDILMSRASGSPELVGSTARISRVRPKLLLSDKIFRIRTVPRVAPGFFAVVFNSRLMRTQIERAISGAEGLANNLPQSELKDFFFVLPPFAEQGEIETFTDAAGQRLDELSAAAQRGIDLLQERRTALISAAVTGQIDVRGLADTKAA